MAKKIKSIKLSILIPTILISFPLLCLLLFTFVTPPNSFLLNKDISLSTRSEVNKEIQKSIILPQTISITHQGLNIFDLNTASISAQINSTSTISNIFSLTAVDKLFFFKPKTYYLSVNYQADLLNQVIKDIQSKVDKPFIPPQIEVDSNGNLSIIDGALGQSLNQAQFIEDLIYRLSYLDSTPISVSLNSLGQLPTADQTQALLAQAEKLKGKQIILNIPNTDPYTITDLTLMSWLNFNSVLDQPKLIKFIDELNQSLRTDPVDAVFQFEEGKVSQFRSSQPGRFIDSPALVTSLTNSVKSLLADQAVSPLDIPFQFIDPVIRNEDANNLGIKELLGRGESSFSHSSAIRNKNIKRGAEVVNFVLVPPGETFSFNKNLGDVSTENGYYMAYIIREGRTELDVGGGICQVSTTMFRAALNAGLPITERRPHAYRVSYYEEGSDPGFDATIFLPSPDLKFENDTDHHILIQSFYDGDNKKLAYEIYGTSDGRTVTIDNYRKWDYSQPPPDKYIDDPTLAPGQVIQIENRIPGLKTAFDWTVTKDGQILHQQTFNSSYTPWAAVFRRGPTP